MRAVLPGPHAVGMNRIARALLALCAILLAAVVGAVLAFVGAILVVVVVTAFQDDPSTSYEGPLVAGMVATPIGALVGMLAAAAFIDHRRRRRPG